MMVSTNGLRETLGQQRKFKRLRAKVRHVVKRKPPHTRSGADGQAAAPEHRHGYYHHQKSRSGSRTKFERL
jgi:hypothetical protein